MDIHTFHAEPGPLPDSLSERIVSESRLAGLPGLKQVGHDPGRWRYLLPYMPLYFRSLDLEAIRPGGRLVPRGRTPRPPSGRRAVRVLLPLADALRLGPPRSTRIAAAGCAGFALGAAAPGLRRLDRKAAQRPDRYYANSEAVRERIASFYGREAEVVHPPVDLEGLEPGEIDGRDVPLGEPPRPLQATRVWWSRRFAAFRIFSSPWSGWAQWPRPLSGHQLPANVRLEGLASAGGARRALRDARTGSSTWAKRTSACRWWRPSQAARP